MDEFSRRPRQVDGDGAAKRRRLRRLRSWWRHEQQTVAAVLARDELYGYAPEDAPSQAAGARYFAMDAGEDVGEAPAAGRPAPLLEVVPQDRVQQRTAEQIVDPVPLVPLLMTLCRRWWNSWWTFSHLSTSLFPSRLSKIECPPRAARAVLRAPQTADQLVEVPTIISYSSLLQRTMEQNVALPVPRGRGGRNADLQGFLRGQSSTAPCSSLERISEQTVEQTVDIPTSGGGLADFRPGQSSSSVAHSPAAWLNPEDEPFQGGFSHFFPGRKKCD